VPGEQPHHLHHHVSNSHSEGALVPCRRAEVHVCSSLRHTARAAGQALRVPYFGALSDESRSMPIPEQTRRHDLLDRRWFVSYSPRAPIFNKRSEKPQRETPGLGLTVWRLPAGGRTATEGTCSPVEWAPQPGPYPVPSTQYSVPSAQYLPSARAEAAARACRCT
jgi:hypothetical protein